MELACDLGWGGRVGVGVGGGGVRMMTADHSVTTTSIHNVVGTTTKRNAEPVCDRY